LTTQELRPPLLVCRRCGAESALQEHIEGCLTCADNGSRSGQDVRYDLAAYRGRELLRTWAQREAGLWSFRELLPLPHEEAPVTLGEGGTPLWRLDVPGPGRIWIKDETRNPTGAFKDRFQSVVVSMARSLGYQKVLASTTGNHGCSLAAFSARGRLQSLVFIDPRSSELQKRLIQFFGARLVSTADAQRHIVRLVRERGWYPCTGSTPMPVATPFGVEGNKTIAFEIYYQLGRRMPSRMVVPVSVGDVIYGPWKGFKELLQLGAEGPAPRMFAVQSSGCDPIVSGFRQGLNEVPVHPDPHTIALSIGDRTAGSHTLTSLYDSRGGAEAVTDGQILTTVRLLADRGIAAEPSAAASVAAALLQQERGEIGAEEDVVCLLTGTAMKWPELLPARNDSHLLSDADAAAIDAWLDAGEPSNIRA
jgi:threonine synthase